MNSFSTSQLILGSGVLTASGNSLYLNGMAISGGSGGGGSYTSSGSYIFNTQINSGVTQQFVAYPTNLGANPYVMCSMFNTGSNENIIAWPSGITSSGYYAQFGWATDDGNYILTTLAANASGLGLTTVNYSVSGGPFYPLNSNPSSYVTPSQTGNFITTEQTGIFATSGNLNVTGIYLYNLIASSSAGVSTLNTLSGMLTITGAGNVTVSNSLPNITVSGNTGIYSTFVTTGNTGIFALNSNLQTTGFTLQTEINSITSISGIWITTGQTGNFGGGGTNVLITGKSISNPDFSGIGGTSVFTSGNFVLISGATGAGGTVGYASGNSNYVYNPQPSITGNAITSTINWQLSDHFYYTLTGNTNFIFTGTQDAMTIVVATHDTNGYTVTFPTGNGNNFLGIKWAGGTGSIPVQTSGYTDVYTFTQFNTGIYVSYVQNF